MGLTLHNLMWACHNFVRCWYHPLASTQGVFDLTSLKVCPTQLSQGWDQTQLSLMWAWIDLAKCKLDSTSTRDGLDSTWYGVKPTRLSLTWVKLELTWLGSTRPYSTRSKVCLAYLKSRCAQLDLTYVDPTWFVFLWTQFNLIKYWLDLIQSNVSLFQLSTT